MLRIDYYTSVNDIPWIEWERFADRRSVGLEIAHLKAVEESGINDIEPYYFIGYDGEKAVGIAYCFIINVDLAGMFSSYPHEVLASVRRWKPGFMNVKLMEVGHIASLGSTIGVLPGYTEDFLVAFSEKTEEISIKENVDLCIIRDITGEQYGQFNILEDHGYKTAMGFPIARMPLRWGSFEEYLNSLKAKRRNNIKQKRAKLLAPEITTEVIEDYAPYSERLAELWKNVAIRNDGYEHERLTPAYFEAMSRNLKGRSHVTAIMHNGEIVAFGLNLIGDEEYFGVAEGLDYDIRDMYDLYSNNMFEGLRAGCELGKKSFNIGITTYDFKSSIGAEPEPTIYFVKAYKNREYSAVYADLLDKNIEQPKTHHRVFRDTEVADHSRIEETKAMLRSSIGIRDPFVKHLKYTRVDACRSAGLYAYCPEFESAQEAVIRYQGKDIVMLGTNSYLGLATHPKVKEAAHKAIDKYGSGCSGSPMMNGTLDIHRQLSTELARFIQKEDALIFSTGYQTNVGVVSALANKDDVLVMDERNHASLVDGARMSRATIVRYRHNDVKSLELVLKKYSDRPKIIITDTLFSMEGTIIDLPRIVELAAQYQCRLMLDESHAIGVMGPGGRGIAEHYGLTDKADIIMGTFSKSLASVGGFIAADRKITDTLKHTARSHIFSASIPPSSVAAVSAALKIIDEEPERRMRVIDNARFLAIGLKALGYNISYNESAIISVHCGDELLALAAYQKLLEEGIFVNPVLSPAVPKNKEMLRISLMSTHEKNMLYHALDVFERLRTPEWPYHVEPSKIQREYSYVD